jgi:endonuclease/exonuclease/phosphatase family metal-dependent hydrolase
LSRPIEKYFALIRHLIVFCYSIRLLWQSNKSYTKLVDKYKLRNVIKILYNDLMNFSLLTYNTLFNKGFDKIEAILDQSHPDIICLQEAFTSDTNLSKLNKFGYKLADYSNSFIQLGQVYGVATFYNPSKFQFVDSSPLKMKGNLTEFLFTILQFILGINKPKSMLRTDFIHKLSKKKITVCNAHLIVIASNGLRINHIEKALNSMNITKKTPLILGGDFNYLPYQRKKLEKAMKKYELIEATKDIRQTFIPKGRKQDISSLQGFLIRRVNHFFGNQMKNDYVFYRGFIKQKTERLNFRFSDHYPILSNFTI